MLHVFGIKRARVAFDCRLHDQGVQNESCPSRLRCMAERMSALSICTSGSSAKLDTASAAAAASSGRRRLRVTAT